MKYVPNGTSEFFRIVFNLLSNARPIAQMLRHHLWYAHHLVLPLCSAHVVLMHSYRATAHISPLILTNSYVLFGTYFLTRYHTYYTFL